MEKKVEVVEKKEVREVAHVVAHEAGQEIVQRAHEPPVDASGDKIFSGSGFVLRATNETIVANETKKVD